MIAAALAGTARHEGHFNHGGGATLGRGENGADLGTENTELSLRWIPIETRARLIF